MFALPRVIAVDNSERELAQIREALLLARVPCLPIPYDAASWPPAGLNEICGAVRLVLLDLNLLDARAPDAGTIAPLIADVLREVAIAGPYILAFWSKHKDLVDDVLAILADRYRNEIVPPLKHVLLDKHDFLITDDQEKNRATAARLSEQVGAILHSVPILEVLTEWETRVANAAASTVSRLCGLAAAGNPWESAVVQEKIADLITWIARETVGRQTAGENPGDGAEQGLMYALADELSRRVGSKEYNSKWANAMPKVGDKAFVRAAGLSPEALNEVFHVDTVLAAKGERGTFTILPGEIMADGKRVKQIFGTTAKALKNEFVNLEGLAQAKKADLLSACRLGLIELSAACDYAQRKERSLRFVLAALIPAAYAENTEFKDPEDEGRRTRESKHEAIYRLPPIKVKEQSYVCKLNFRYILGLTKDSELLGDPLFRIRVPLLDEIAFRCSNHLARPGIIAFR